jgi:hypothetical protein
VEKTMIDHANLKSAVLLLTVATSFNVAAYYDEKADEACREPKIQEFNLPEYSANQTKEVPPEANFSFVVSGWADPKKIKVMGKDKVIPFEVESTDTYHRVKGKIPAEFNGKFVRLNVRIPAILGCYSTQGWLLKVAGQVAANPPATPVDQAAQPAVVEKTVAPTASSPADKPVETTAPMTGGNTKPAEPASEATK